MDEELDFDRWEAAIGKIIISYARVEFELMSKYEEFLPEDNYFKDRFADRLKKIENLYNTECGKNAKASALFKKIKDQAKLRNLVAHNPVLADVTNGVLTFKIYSARKPTVIYNVVELEQQAQSISNLCINFSVLLRVWARNES
jgi:hypothetical protein